MKFTLMKSGGRGVWLAVLLPALVVSPASMHAQETPEAAETAPAAAEPKAEQPVVVNLSAQRELVALLSEAQNLQVRQRFVDALQKLDEAEAKFPGTADIHNIRGSILLTPSLRDFERSEEQFRRALELQPSALAPQFNLAEVAFVRHEWKTAAEKFQTLMQKHPRLPLSVRHLVVFKVMVCKLKLGEVADAEALMNEHFSFMDDTPAYYYAKAAMAFQVEDAGKAQEWMAKAAVIFKEKENTPYVDTLMEARWVPHLGLQTLSDDSK